MHKLIISGQVRHRYVIMWLVGTPLNMDMEIQFMYGRAQMAYQTPFQNRRFWMCGLPSMEVNLPHIILVFKSYYGMS